ncbi:hypothetical protein [Thermococcus pacificus]|nr:hypothetical protein [Thermococcus pacificus]
MMLIVPIGSVEEYIVDDFSNSIVDTDIKGATYCPSCEARLKENLGVVS